MIKGIPWYYHGNTYTKQVVAMRKSAKFAVSLPWEDFKELEAVRFALDME